MTMMRQWVGASMWIAFALPSSGFAQGGGDADGERLYAQLGCAVCHGAEGHGTHAGPRLASGELELDAFVAAIRNPAGTMPAYEAEVVPDQDLAAVHEYLGPVQRAHAGEVSRGADLYRRYGCYECHADEAQGGMHGPRLGPDAISFARFSWYVRNPTGQMPPYTTTVLSDQETSAIYAFVKSRPRPPDVASIPLLVP